jgi:hypothetical protein
VQLPDPYAKTVDDDLMLTRGQCQRKDEAPERKQGRNVDG